VWRPQEFSADALQETEVIPGVFAWNAGDGAIKRGNIALAISRGYQLAVPTAYNPNVAVSARITFLWIWDSYHP
jgi:hypothetical protein